MKVINAEKNIIVDDLFNYLQKKLNSLFQAQRQSDITFNIIKNGQEIEINQPELYEGFLFKLQVEDNKLVFTKSEHYVDDINVITLESILDLLFVEQFGATTPQL